MRRPYTDYLLTSLLLILVGSAQWAAAAEPKELSPAGKIGEAKRDANGLLVHPVESDLQAGPTQIRVLLPERLDKGRRYPVLYVLPVEAGTGTKYGDGLLEVKKLGLHNQHGLICVQPTFAQLPWYVDHATDPKVRQESYFLKVVVPAVEQRYPAIASAQGRLLLGFSKSGWGAFSLLLRHPEQFGRAAAWDAPLHMDRPRFGMADIVGTQENFENYCISKLLEKRAGLLQKEKRLALTGCANFREHHQVIHNQMVRLKIPHDYLDIRKERHAWDAGWVAETVKLLVRPADPSQPRP